MLTKTLVNGCKMLAFIQTGTNDGKPCGYALFERKSKTDGPAHEYVTADYRLGDTSWLYGRYVDEQAEAYGDLFARASRRLGIKPKTAYTDDD